MSQPYLAVFASSSTAFLNAVRCHAAHDRVLSVWDALRYRFIDGIPPVAACRPAPTAAPVGSFYGMPVWIDPLCPRDTWYVIGVYDPEPAWPTIAEGVR